MDWEKGGGGDVTDDSLTGCVKGKKGREGEGNMALPRHM